MPEREFLNAVELRPHHAGRLVEFTTVTTPEMRAYGIGELGAHVMLRGRVSQVENGITAGRAWSRVTYHVEHAGGLVRLISVLGGHVTVEVLPDPADRP